MDDKERQHRGQTAEPRSNDAAKPVPPPSEHVWEGASFFPLTRLRKPARS